MKREHCDNCDELIEMCVIHPSRLLTIQPLGYQCELTVQISKLKGDDTLPQYLCGICLLAAVEAWVVKIKKAL